MRTLVKAIVGSHCYGLNTENSDIDFKSIYLQDNEDILSNRYKEQINYDKDSVGYELRRFLELAAKGNPNVLELLYIKREFILVTSPEYEFLRTNRDIFLTKTCFKTYSGYAYSQLKKAKGLNKKFNWEEKRIKRKDFLDFVKIIDVLDGKVYTVKDYVKSQDRMFSQKDILENIGGFVSIDGFRDCYKFYTNHGQGLGNGDEPKLSKIESGFLNGWVGIAYFNREAHSTHCKEYREYQSWLKNRNEHRVATNKEHGQQMDSKNIMHLVRLLLTAREIVSQKTINVFREKEREYLLSIRRGEFNLKQILDHSEKEINEIEKLFIDSDLPDYLNIQNVKDLELNIRNGNLEYELSDS